MGGRDSQQAKRLMQLANRLLIDMQGSGVAAHLVLALSLPPPLGSDTIHFL